MICRTPGWRRVRGARLLRSRAQRLRLRVVLGCLVLSTGLGACTVNPLTGSRELGWVTPAQEISIGTQQYRTAQQLQGGVYRTDADLTAYVERVGQRLAGVSGVALPYEFVVLNNSTPNAWALPGGKIAVNRGLLVALTNEAELAAVLGHEIAHAAARHGAQRLQREQVLQVVLAGAAAGMSDSVLADETLGGAELVAGLLTQKYSRDAERQADAYGIRFMAAAGYDPRGAVTLQETFLQLAGEQRMDWMQGLLASHPASAERLANNRQMVQERGRSALPARLGEADFARATAALKAAQPSFDRYDVARLRYNNGAYDGALEHINAALADHPEEAIFHALRGAIRQQQGRFDDAWINFDRALQRDADFYGHYLGRGRASVKLGRTEAARTDLMRSVERLPTAAAYQLLGELAEAEGDMDAARQFYALASRSPSG